MTLEQLTMLGLKAQIIGVGITTIAILVSSLTLFEMIKTRRASNRAHIIVGYEMNHDNMFIYLYVENIGNLVATNIEVELSNPIILKDKSDAREILFGDKLNYLPSNHKINTVLAPIWEIPKEWNDSALNSVKITYKDVNGRRYSEKYNMDVKPFINRLYLEQKSISQNISELVEAINNMNKE